MHLPNPQDLLAQLGQLGRLNPLVQSVPLLQLRHSALPNPRVQLDLPDRFNPQVQMGQLNPLRQLYRSVPSQDGEYLILVRLELR